MSHDYILTLRCPDRIGIVAKVSGFITSHKGWIIEASQHSDDQASWFFMRVVIKADSLALNLEQFREKFTPIADAFSMQWRISDTSIKKRVILMVSNVEHCLADLLYRWRSGEMPFEIPCIISNHDTFQSIAEWHKIPFHHVPVIKDKKEESFAAIDKLFESYQADTIVLARYMQILPPTLCEQYHGQIINIHHSFLPSFAGAKPYEKAYQKGVKLIGATCHYVTSELDEGPIIEQDVIRVDHSHTVNDMIRLGKDVEKTVLARGLRNHIEDRILLHDNKTVVFA